MQPRSRTRLHHVYFVLAAFDLVCVSLSLFTISRLGDIYAESVIVNQQWAARLSDFRELHALASAVNAPANDVFKSRDVKLETRRFSDAVDVFTDRMAIVRFDLSKGVADQPESANLQKELDAVGQKMAEMESEAKGVFASLQEDRVNNASQQMAAMDRFYGTLMEKLGRLAQLVGGIQKRTFDEQAAKAQELRRLEHTIVALVVLMVIGVTFYGRKLAQRMVESENQVRHWNAQLEQRVNDRTIELTRANEHLSERQQRLKAIFDTADCAIVTFDDRGVVESINQAGQELFQRSAEEVVNGDMRLLLGGDVSSEIVGQESSVAAEFLMANRLRELTGQRKDGTTFPFQFLITEVPLPDRHLFTGIIRDLTAEKRAVQAERLASIGQLVAGISHESRNALQRIQMGVENLSCEFEDGNVATAAREDLSLIARSTTDLVRLFEELRSFAASINLEFSDCNLSNLWRKAWDNLDSERNGRQVELVEHIDGMDLMCHVDSFRIEQVFRNLMENSLAACEDPVRIQIDCTEAKLDGASAVQIRLHDNGPGLSDEQQQRIFEAFFTTKRKGTGLGMAIVRRVFEAHHGTIVARNSNPGGAEFVMTLLRENS